MPLVPDATSPCLTPCQLRDVIFTDQLGRKVVVDAPSRTIAANAINALLFQLRHCLTEKKTKMEGSQWRYIGRVRPGWVLVAQVGGHAQQPRRAG